MPDSDVRLHLGLVAAIAVVAAAALARLYSSARGTTLLAVWMWSLIAMLVVVGTEMAILTGIVNGGGEGIAAIRFAAAAATFCPIVALLGAKRPQDRAWQLIVSSFWVILALPAAQALLLRPGQAFVVHPIWSWFLVVLIVVGASNYLPTRNAIAALLAAAGQAVLVWHELPWGSGPVQNAANDWMPIVGAALLAAAVGIAALTWLRRSRREAASHVALERLWSDFCDQFGVVWGLRVAERVNVAAAQNHWNVRLAWHGVTRDHVLPLTPNPSPTKGRGKPPVAAPPSPSAAEIENLQQSLLPLVRRFVSKEWIDRRLGEKPS
jgi:hypothetical protein